MEAATPLRPPRIAILANRLVVDGLAVDDPCAVELVRSRAEAGDDPARVVTDALEIGARVLDREQTGANAEFVRTEFEKASREVETAFSDRARVVAEFFGAKVDEVFGAEDGRLAKELERHFSDGSSAAVQHRVREMVAEVMAKSREDLVRQFSSADASNPLADFKAAHVAAFNRAAAEQVTRLEAMNDHLTALKLEVQKLQDERVRHEEVAAEHARSTAKGRPYEEAVFEAVDAIAHSRGDDCDAVGDVRGAGGKRGDVLVAVDGCAGPSRGRIVIEAKHSYETKNQAVAQLDAAMEQRDADYGVWVVPSEALLPGSVQHLREVNGDKLFVVYDPEDGSRLALEVGYALARARVLMAGGDGGGLDGPALRAEVERTVAAMEAVRRIKTQLTTAAGGIGEARRILEEMAAEVRERLGRIDELLDAAPPTTGVAPTPAPARARRAQALAARQASFNLIDDPVRSTAPE